MKFKRQFIASFILILVSTHLIFFLVSNLINSFIFNSKKWEGTSFIIPSTLVVCFFLILGIFISTKESLKFFKKKNKKDNYMSLGKFLNIFFIVLILANLFYQFILYQKNFNISLNNIDTIKYLITGDNSIITKAKKVFLIMNIITAILSNAFILLMIPYSKKKIAIVEK